MWITSAGAALDRGSLSFCHHWKCWMRPASLTQTSKNASRRRTLSEKTQIDCSSNISKVYSKLAWQSSNWWITIFNERIIRNGLLSLPSPFYFPALEICVNDFYTWSKPYMIVIVSHTGETSLYVSLVLSMFFFSSITEYLFWRGSNEKVCVCVCSMYAQTERERARGEEERKKERKEQKFDV